MYNVRVAPAKNTNAGVTHGRIEVKHLCRRHTLVYRPACTKRTEKIEHQAIVKRALHEFEVRRNTKLYAW